MTNAAGPLSMMQSAFTKDAPPSSPRKTPKTCLASSPASAFSAAVGA